MNNDDSFDFATRLADLAKNLPSVRDHIAERHQEALVELRQAKDCLVAVVALWEEEESDGNPSPISRSYLLQHHAHMANIRRMAEETAAHALIELLAAAEQGLGAGVNSSVEA